MSKDRSRVIVFYSRDKSKPDLKLVFKSGRLLEYNPEEDMKTEFWLSCSNCRHRHRYRRRRQSRCRHHYHYYCRHYHYYRHCHRYHCHCRHRWVRHGSRFFVRSLRKLIDTKRFFCIPKIYKYSDYVSIDRL